MTLDPVIDWSLRGALALLFAAAAWHKIGDRVRFEAAVRTYALTPPWAPGPLSVGLPLVEVGVALGLLLPEVRTAAALAGAVLLVIYSVAVLANLVRGRRDIDCGCFSSFAEVPLGGVLLLRNGVLVAACLALQAPIRARPLVWLDVLTVAGALIAVATLWGAAQRLSRSGQTLRNLGGAR